MRKRNNTSILNLSYIRGGVMGIIAMTMVGLFSFNAYGECTPAPDCASIGYTETSCETISLKCPFDPTKLYCFPCDTKYQYSCNQENTIGFGESCNNKYTSCCNTSCSVGAIYYSDKTCSSCVYPNKNPVGIIVKDNELIMNLVQPSMTWATEQTDIAGITNYPDIDSAITDYNGYANTLAIVAYYGENTDTSTNAGVYCYNYAPSGFENSKNKWYLPALGELYDTYYKKHKILASTYDKLGLSNLKYVWSSTEYYLTEDVWGIVYGGYISTDGTKTTNAWGVSCFLSIN